jgi:hypothetical protein
VVLEFDEVVLDTRTQTHLFKAIVFAEKSGTGQVGLGARARGCKQARNPRACSERVVARCMDLSVDTGYQ